jgi:hypothetical protein
VAHAKQHASLEAPPLRLAWEDRGTCKAACITRGPTIMPRTGRLWHMQSSMHCDAFTARESTDAALAKEQTCCVFQRVTGHLQMGQGRFSPSFFLLHPKISRKVSCCRCSCKPRVCISALRLFCEMHLKMLSKIRMRDSVNAWRLLAM